MKKIIIISVIVLIVLSAGTYFLVKNLGGPTSPVRADEVVKKDITSKVVAFGRTQPTKEVTISAKVSGEIIGMYVEEGDTVSRGDTLLKVNPEQYKAQLEQRKANLRAAKSSVAKARANYQQAEEEYERAKTMYNKDLTSEEEFHRAQTNYEVAKAQLNSAIEGVQRARGQLKEAREALDETIIVSPQDGVVIGLYKEQGEYVVVGRVGAAGSSIMKIAQLADMECKVDVDETDIPEVEEGQDVQLEFDAFPNRKIKGKVMKISNEAQISNQGSDSEVANFPVRIAIIKKVQKIKPGMSVKADIITQRVEDVLAVPIQAVVEKTPEELGIEKEEKESADKENKPNPDNKENFKKKASHRRSMGGSRRGKAVFTIENSKAKANLVKTGIMDDRYMEIKSGLEEGDKIVVGSYKAIRTLKNNDDVKILKTGSDRKKGSFHD